MWVVCDFVNFLNKWTSKLPHLFGNVEAARQSRAHWRKWKSEGIWSLSCQYLLPARFKTAGYWNRDGRVRTNVAESSPDTNRVCGYLSDGRHSPCFTDKEGTLFSKVTHSVRTTGRNRGSNSQCAPAPASPAGRGLSSSRWNTRRTGLSGDIPHVYSFPKHPQAFTRTGLLRQLFPAVRSSHWLFFLCEANGNIKRFAQ